MLSFFGEWIGIPGCVSYDEIYVRYHINAGKPWQHFSFFIMDLIKYHENLEVYAKMDLVNPPSSKSTKPPKEQCLLARLGGLLVYINIQY